MRILRYSLQVQCSSISANGQQILGPLPFNIYDCVLGSIAPSASVTVTADVTSQAQASGIIAIMDITANSMSEVEENITITS